MSASAVIDAEGAVAFLFDTYDGLRRFTPLFEHQANAINRGLRGNPNGLRRGYLAAVVVEEAELFRQRVTLCDLLWGRSMRMRASKEFENVLELERRPIERPSDDQETLNAIVGPLTEASRELMSERTALCDLLHGRSLRGYADFEMRTALYLERTGAPREAVSEALDRAAHREWMAIITERGQVVWGSRNNRCGRSEQA